MGAYVRILKDNESGYVLMIVMLILVILTVIGVAANRTSNVEMQIATNEKHYTDCFYQTEATLTSALESAEGVGGWLTGATPLLLSASGWFTYYVDLGSDGSNDGYVEIRRIDDTVTTDIVGLSSAANDVPLDSHKGPPPPNGGYSVVNYEIRRYNITTTGVNAQCSTAAATTQAGAWKAFNKF